MTWERTGFVFTPANVPLEQAKKFVDRLVIQVAFGTTIHPIPKAWMDRARGLGFELYAWAWGTGQQVEEEARVHALAARGFSAFVANLEHPYDAHGNSMDEKFKMPTRYLNALDWEGPLGLTTNPRFASDMSAWVEREACYMVQAFPLENKVSLTHGVEFAQSWGWPRELQRPLMQSYYTNGVRPDPTKMNAEAESLGVGGIPYTIEQAMDPEGKAWLETMKPTIERPYKSSGGIVTEPDEGEDLMAKIGTDHGITAFVNWLQQQPGVPVNHTPHYDPNKPGTWPWPERLERTLNMLREDHDSRN